MEGAHLMWTPTALVCSLLLRFCEQGGKDKALAEQSLQRHELALRLSFGFAAGSFNVLNSSDVCSSLASNETIS